jgi:FKBP-type peptidyl-prolyl cis-trans isomerase
MSNYRAIILCIVTACTGCGDPSQAPTAAVSSKNGTEKQIREQFMRANSLLMQKENDEMDQYERSHKLSFIKTPSGIRYLVYKPSPKGDSIRQKMKVTMEYKLMLLDGTLCYSSDEEGPRTFIVGEEDIESGIHKGLEYLKKGDKAMFLIPSPLAHGLLGDSRKIPPQMPIVYDVHVHTD